MLVTMMITTNPTNTPKTTLATMMVVVLLRVLMAKHCSSVCRGCTTGGWEENGVQEARGTLARFRLWTAGAEELEHRSPHTLKVEHWESLHS